MQPYHDARPLPSPGETARALRGHVRRDGSVAFPGPGRKPKDRSCTFTYRPEAPNGFIVGDAREELDDSVLLDHVREKLGLEPFKPRRDRGNTSNGHRPPAAPSLKITGDTSSNGQIVDKASRIYLVAFADIRLGKSRRDLIKGLIPRVGLTIIWGPPKCGKSFLAFDMAMRVALGWEYRGRRVHPGPVVYCAFEGQTGIEARAEAYRQKFLAEETDPPPFFLEPVTLNLVREHQDLIEAIRRQLPDTSPVLVVLDTLNRSLQGSESSDEDMSAYVRAADAIREAFQCAVVIVHHCGHEGSRPRGHSSLLGAADATIAVRKESAGQIIATVELMKDGAAGDCFASRLEPLDVGLDEDGAIVSSCVVTPVEISTIATSHARISGAAGIALDLLKRAIADAGEAAPTSNHIPRESRTTTVNLWRRYCYEGMVAESDNPDSRQKAFVRASKRLQQLGLIGIWGDHVWVTGHARQ